MTHEPIANTGPVEAVSSSEVDWSEMVPARLTVDTVPQMVMTQAQLLNLARADKFWWLDEATRKWRADGISPFVEPPPPRPPMLRRRLTAIPALTTIVCARAMQGVET